MAVIWLKSLKSNDSAQMPLMAHTSHGLLVWGWGWGWALGEAAWILGLRRGFTPMQQPLKLIFY